MIVQKITNSIRLRAILQANFNSVIYIA